MLTTFGTSKKFGDAKGVITGHKPNKNRQHNEQMKRGKMTNKDLQALHRKLKIEQHEPQ